jgi:hypothetical protein
LQEDTALIQKVERMKSSLESIIFGWFLESRLTFERRVEMGLYTQGNNLLEVVVVDVHKHSEQSLENRLHSRLKMLGKWVICKKE